MDSFLVRLLITIGIVWLTQVILSTLKIKEPANSVIFIVTLGLMIFWLVIGYTFLPAIR